MQAQRHEPDEGHQNVTVIASSVPIPQPTSETAAVLTMIERAARDPSVDIDKMQRLLAMHEAMVARKAEQAFADAMAAAQAEMRPVAADAENPQTRSRYASYAALDRALRPIYARHGISLSFNTADGAPDNYVRVVCTVRAGGHSETYHVDMPADGKGAKGGDVMTKTHAVGSAMSYGMRYLLKMIFNVAVGEDDDDGNAAGGGEAITDEQLQYLIALCEEVGADKIKFCKYLRIDALAHLPASRMQEAVAALEAKRTKK